MFVDLAKYSVPDFGEASINETQANFTSQNAAAYIHNGQGLADLKKRGLNYSWAKILQPLAGPSGEAYSYGVMDVDLMFATGNEDITGKFLEKWHQSKYMGEVINAAGWVPNQSSFVADIPAFSDTSNELVSPFVKMEPQARFKPSITCWEEIQKILADSITKAVYGEMTAKAAFAKAEIECNEVLAAQ
jgi:maltose-binding protein MalE